jgi:hypothetical protein
MARCRAGRTRNTSAMFRRALPVPTTRRPFRHPVPKRDDAVEPARDHCIGNHVEYQAVSRVQSSRVLFASVQRRDGSCGRGASASVLPLTKSPERRRPPLPPISASSKPVSTTTGCHGRSRSRTRASSARRNPGARGRRGRRPGRPPRWRPNLRRESLPRHIRTCCPRHRRAWLGSSARQTGCPR